MKILIATDGSKFGEEAIAYCQNLLAYHKEAEIIILSVIERVTPVGTEPFAGSQQYYVKMQNFSLEQATGFVEKAANRLRDAFSGRDFEITGEVVKGPVSREIIKKAEEWKADLIVVGSHGYGYWERTLLGSVSDAVVHLAPCSVLVVRDKETKGEKVKK